MNSSTMTAVYINNGSKAFRNNKVLENFNMHVEKGIIYALLGSSGCGKTTILNCIVGRKKLDSGTIWVLGGPPGSNESAVFSPSVGYMPQDTALVPEFTVKSAMYYFGRIASLDDKDIEKRFQELTQLLDLPPANKTILNCSGGQQRRVSFAVALISKPELLVLDEPTVGLDPLIREGIWKYLLKLTDSHYTSVIMTTHYIEEARQAHKIGLMRNGRLLAENSPQSLLNQFQCQSMEDVFVILSKNETGETIPQVERYTLMIDSSLSNLNSDPSAMVLTELANFKQVVPVPDSKNYTDYVHSLNWYRLKALIGKNWLQVSRNYILLSVMFVVPVFQILSFFLIIGDDVKDIKIAVTNHENNFSVCKNVGLNDSDIFNGFKQCKFQQLGCSFYKHLNDPMLNVITYNNIRTARNDIRHGKVTAALYIPENFTEFFYDKVIDGSYDYLTLNNSQIQVWMDMSNTLLGSMVKKKLTEKMVQFQKLVLESCNISDKTVALPVNFLEYMYGSTHDTFAVFMVPGLLITAMHIMGIANTATIVLTERLEGVWDRSIVAGVYSVEIIVVHFVTQLIIISIQATIGIIVTFPIYKTENVGSYIVITTILLLAGVGGISYGYLISVISSGYTMSHIIVIGTLFPLMLLSGLMWPLEGMPTLLQWITLALPAAMPITSLRNVMKKGWGIFHKNVINGIGIEILWIVILLYISTVEIKKRR